jgi:hypothetical protein
MSFPRLFSTALLFLTITPMAHSQNVRLTNDFSGGGYVSAYTLATGNPYTDAVLKECSISRGRQNEPAVAVDPRNTNILIGSSNDYCGVFYVSINGVPAALGPIWLGYYRSENGGASFQSSLVPGYPPGCVALCSTRPGAYSQRRRPGYRMGCARSRLHGIGKLR